MKFAFDTSTHLLLEMDVDDVAEEIKPVVRNSNFNTPLDLINLCTRVHSSTINIQ